MTTSILLGILFGSLGAICLNVGKGVQKMKVHVWKEGLRPAFRPEHRRDLRVWGIGFVMTSSASIVLSLGLLFAPASVVSAMTGVGLVALAFFSSRVLEERIGVHELAGISIVIVGTTALALGTRPTPDPESFHLPVLGWALALGGLAFAAPVAYTRRTGRLHGLVYGLLAGTLLGSSMTMGKVALVAAKEVAADREIPVFFAQVLTPYPYLALTIGTGALVITQIAFFKGRAVVVVPCVNSITILAPALLERRLFDTTLGAAQYVALAVIVLGVIVISSSRDEEIDAARAAARETSE